MIIEISVAVIAACFVLILIRLYTVSIRIEDTMRRLEEFISRMETDIRPILFNANNVMNDLSGIVEITKRGTKRVEQVLETLLGPIQTLGIFLKAIKIGMNTFLKKKGGDDNGM